MKHESNDLRVRRTLKAIRTAFYELILERPFRSVSITELTSRAGINRKTFYLHYTSMNELVSEVEGEIVDEILSKLENYPGDVDVAICIKVFYSYLTEADEVRTKLLCDPEYDFFYKAVVSSMLETPFFLKYYQNSDHPYIVKAYCASITSIYRAWRKDSDGLSLDELVDYACTLLLDGYHGISK